MWQKFCPFCHSITKQTAWMTLYRVHGRDVCTCVHVLVICMLWCGYLYVYVAVKTKSPRTIKTIDSHENNDLIIYTLDVFLCDS